MLQGIGLFPHRTVAQNVATVPELLGWPRAKIAERVEEMLDLVGLDPGEYRDRRPHALSGGQRQRVGVARALAADPPILLMDEPFGAVDPLVRGRLQAEIGAILKRLSKTVMIVTHDIGEGLLMGDQVVLMHQGRIVQADTPARLLAKPADAFVADFIGGDRTLRLLDLATVADIAEDGPGDPGGVIAPDASLKEALEQMLAGGLASLSIEGADPARRVTLEAIRARSRQAPEIA